MVAENLTEHEKSRLSGGFQERAPATFSPRRVHFAPVAGDIDSACHPNLVVALHIIEKFFERERTARPTDEAAVKTYIHQLRCAFCTLAIEIIEIVFEVGVEMLARVETLRRGKAHIIRIKRIGNDEMRTLRAMNPIRKIIRISVGRIEKAALLHHQDLDRCVALAGGDAGELVGDADREMRADVQQRARAAQLPAVIGRTGEVAPGGARTRQRPVWVRRPSRRRPTRVVPSPPLRGPTAARPPCPRGR